MDEYIIQVRVEAVDRNGEAVVRKSIPVPLRPHKKRLRNTTVLDVKKSIRTILGVPIRDQTLSGPVPSEEVLDDGAILVERGVVPGIKSRAHSRITAGELFTTVGVAAARSRLQLASSSFSSSDVLVLSTKHPLREYILTDGFYYRSPYLRDPCLRFLVYSAVYLACAAASLALAHWLWHVGKLALPKPKVWLNIEKKVIKFMMLQDLDEDIPLEIREKLEKLEL